MFDHGRQVHSGYAFVDYSGHRECEPADEMKFARFVSASRTKYTDGRGETVGSEVDTRRITKCDDERVCFKGHSSESDQRHEDRRQSSSHRFIAFQLTVVGNSD